MELELSLTIFRIVSINFENPPPQKFLVSLSLLAITSNARRNCPALQESAYVYIMIAFAGFSFLVLRLESYIYRANIHFCDVNRNMKKYINKQSLGGEFLLSKWEAQKSQQEKDTPRLSYKHC